MAIALASRCSLTGRKRGVEMLWNLESLGSCYDVNNERRRVAYCMQGIDFESDEMVLPKRQDEPFLGGMSSWLFKYRDLSTPPCLH